MVAGLRIGMATKVLSSDRMDQRSNPGCSNDFTETRRRECLWRVSSEMIVGFNFLIVKSSNFAGILMGFQVSLVVGPSPLTHSGGGFSPSLPSAPIPTPEASLGSFSRRRFLPFSFLSTPLPGMTGRISHMTGSRPRW